MPNGATPSRMGSSSRQPARNSRPRVKRVASGCMRATLAEEVRSMPLKPSAQRVQDALRAAGFSNEVIELPDSARTAGEAAAAVGCEVGQIVKSLLFEGRPSG